MRPHGGDWLGDRVHGGACGCSPQWSPRCTCFSCLFLSAGTWPGITSVLIWLQGLLTQGGRLAGCKGREGRIVRTVGIIWYNCKHRTHLCEVSTSHHFCSNPGRGAGLTTIVAHGTSMKIQAAGAGETRLWTFLLALTRNQAVLRWRYSDGLFYNETLCFEFRTLGSGSQPFCLPALLAWQGIYNNRCRWTTDLIFKSLLEVFILSLPFPIFFHISYFMPFHLIQHKRYLNFRVCQNNCLTFFFFQRIKWYGINSPLPLLISILFIQEKSVYHCQGLWGDITRYNQPPPSKQHVF